LIYNDILKLKALSKYTVFIERFIERYNSELSKGRNSYDKRMSHNVFTHARVRLIIHKNNDIRLDRLVCHATST